MYCKSAFTYPHNFHINIYNINLSKKLMKIAFFVVSNAGRPLNN